MRVARGSASLLLSHGRGIAPQDALKKDSRGRLRVGAENPWFPCILDDALGCHCPFLLCLVPQDCIRVGFCHRASSWDDGGTTWRFSSCGGILEFRRAIQSSSCVGPGKSYLPFEFQGRAGDCSRVTSGQNRPHLGLCPGLNARP